MYRIAATVVLLASLATACTYKPSLPPSDAERVFVQGTALLSQHPAGSIERAKWPSAIAALRPKSVYVAKDGLYIRTSIFFVEERGFYVPHSSASVVVTPTTDPSYEPLAAGVFTYLIKG